jgi:glycosyltransferase involved in cell wall biosynthesis
VSARRPSVCLITSGLEAGHLRLQPWRYLHQVARQLAGHGHPVNVISDGYPRLPGHQLLGGVSVYRRRSVSNPWWRPDKNLQKTIQRLNPEVVLWHVGLTSFLYQRLACPGAVPIVGIFTSPLYDFRQLYRLGWRKLGAGRDLSAVHLLGSLAPRPLLRWLAKKNRQLKCLVVQTRTTQAQIVNLALWPGPVEVIPPAVDGIWRNFNPNGQTMTRARLGYAPGQKIVVYYGPPASLRGLPTLIHAFEKARLRQPALELLILCRLPADKPAAGQAVLNQLLATSPAREYIKLVSGHLPAARLVGYVATADVVALPFEIVPSDAPLSPLEAIALGKPLVTTDVACLPELLGHNLGYITRPADPAALADSLLKAIREDHNRVPGSTYTRSWADVGREWSTLFQKLNLDT